VNKTYVNYVTFAGFSFRQRRKEPDLPAIVANVGRQAGRRQWPNGFNHGDQGGMSSGGWRA
jgi:hypothetical protein